MTILTSSTPVSPENVHSFSVARDAGKGTTVTPRGNDDSNIFQRQVINATSVPESPNKAARSFKRQIVGEHRPALVNKKVAGSVLQVGEISVSCEFLVDGRVINTTLPLELFATTPEFGEPISLEMIEDNGYRTPRITKRQLADDREVIELRSKIDGLLAEF
jgi:hypothetical protein